MDGGPEGVWISADKAKRRNSIVTTRSPSFPRRDFAADGRIVYRSVRASLPAASRLTLLPKMAGPLTPGRVGKWPTPSVAIHVLIETPDQVFAEHIAHPAAAATGRRIHHTFAARLVAGGGEIKLLRESLNVIAVAQALLPGGVADLPRPSDEIYSFKPGYQS
jgi:hypothetical protein